METLNLKLSAPYFYPTKANSQQGPTTTCEDFAFKANAEAERGFWSGA